MLAGTGFHTNPPGWCERETRFFYISLQRGGVNLCFILKAAKGSLRCRPGLDYGGVLKS